MWDYSNCHLKIEEKSHLIAVHSQSAAVIIINIILCLVTIGLHVLHFSLKK